MYFERKHVETGTNCLHKLATFFNYHMPSMFKNTWKVICHIQWKHRSFLFNKNISGYENRYLCRRILLKKRINSFFCKMHKTWDHIAGEPIIFLILQAVSTQSVNVYSFGFRKWLTGNETLLSMILQKRIIFLKTNKRPWSPRKVNETEITILD